MNKKIVFLILIFSIIPIGLYFWQLKNNETLEFENVEKMNVIEDDLIEGSEKEDKIIKGEEFKEIIKQIKEDYLKVNNCEDCDVIEKDFNEKSTEGGEILVYTKDNELQKIVKKYYGEMGKNIYELYYKEDKLFFVYVKSYKYNRPIYWDEKKLIEENLNDDEVFDMDKAKIFENRYYLFRGKLKLWIDNDGYETEAGKEFFEKENFILDMNKKTLDLYYK